MKAFLVIPFVGALYSLFFGLLPAARHEGISARFFVESLAITTAASLPGIFGFFRVNPVLYLFLVYCITMRVRLLLDLGSAFARRGRLKEASKVYRIASRLWPDPSGCLMVLVNQAACSLRQGDPQRAISQLECVLENAVSARLGRKYLAACHCNLGLAYWRTGRAVQAESELHAVSELWPLSEYARHAEHSLAKIREAARHVSASGGSSS